MSGPYPQFKILGTLFFGLRYEDLQNSEQLDLEIWMELQEFHFI